MLFDEGAYRSIYREELKYYLRSLPEDRRRRINTLDWWRNNESKYPVLSRLARDILNVPMSTVASESAFSQGRQQLGDNRHSLGSNAMDVLVCLRDWIRAERRNLGMEPEPNDEQKLKEIMTSRENSAESSPMHGFAPIDFDYPMQVLVNINMDELEKMMHSL
ncbi:zinc finger BED domain-containing protein RICESLEEPER 4-like [Capsicum galapagoense]